MIFNTYLIIYLTRNKEIIYRLVKNLPLYENHSYTSMGWYIVDIQIFYQGKFVALDFYEKERNKRLEKFRKKTQRKALKRQNSYFKKKKIIKQIFKKYL